MPIIRNNPILRVIGNIFIPIILLYALYVQFHGEYGAGGGFQAGVIFATGLILYVLIYGGEHISGWLSLRRTQCIASVGLLGYIGVGIAGLLKGGNFLDYSVLADTAQKGQQIGIFLVELSIGITIVGVVMLIFGLIIKQVARE